MKPNNPIDQSDEALAQKLSTGDVSALSELINRYQLTLTRYIQRHCYSCFSDTDDILQEVFLKVYTHICDFDVNLKFSSWIYRITHNLMVSKIRKNAKWSKEEIFDETLISSTLFAADSSLQSRDFAQKLKIIMELMPSKLKDVFILRFLEDKDYNEISDILKENTNTIATRIKRSREFAAKEALNLDLHLTLGES